MRKTLICVFLVFGLMIFSEFSINFGIMFGNYDVEPYTLILITEPFLDVYIDGDYIGQTDIFGQLKISFGREGYHFVEIKSDSYLVISKNVFISANGVILKIRPQKAGSIVIFSNVYPVNVYLDNAFYGVVKDKKDELKIPIGAHKLKFFSPGYKVIEKDILISFKEKVPVELNFHKKNLDLYLRNSYDEFSPNGDWYRDKWDLEIFLTTFATITIDIFSENEKVESYRFSGVPGENIFKWNGIKKTGEYLVVVTAYNESEKVMKDTNVKINMEKYTYLKEITILGLFVIFSGIVYVILK
ncbi:MULTISPECIES: PEGA domain-containing protein [unclassified Thermosipho (in: thermotogales)]|uniref:PEGA domain-containing protein n=1 Tax=unclassified Thermosipho (in: thermotogales) TaxID=2676525 RepID=UPI000985F63B|nr:MULTISPECIES: PEGA domain-containing protein [unclassified Thermosipho (in: thermotogales)]MBT1247935.1 hypothetical protein [Thermosipho sp. 1244]OOC46106.1 hypothetical protein XO09_08300 [Thermosipho sp. 1223]